jgi:transcriptional regulator with XRE-family HTH domain
MSQRERAIALGAAIRAAREQAGLTQEEAASQAELPTDTGLFVTAGRHR